MADDRIRMGGELLRILTHVAVELGMRPPRGCSLTLALHDLAADHAAGCAAALDEVSLIKAVARATLVDTYAKLVGNGPDAVELFDGHSYCLERIARHDTAHRTVRRNALDIVKRAADFQNDAASKGRKLLVAIGAGMLIADPERPIAVPAEMQGEVAEILAEIAAVIPVDERTKLTA